MEIILIINFLILSQVTTMKTRMTSGKPCIQRKKLVVVGDGDTGKTSTVFVFTKSKYPEVHVPTILETEVVEVTPAGNPGRPRIELEVWDTAGQEDYDRLRPISYPKTDVFVVCFRYVLQSFTKEMQHL